MPGRCLTRDQTAQLMAVADPDTGTAIAATVHCCIHLEQLVEARWLPRDRAVQRIRFGRRLYPVCIELDRYLDLWFDHHSTPTAQELERRIVDLGRDLGIPANFDNLRASGIADLFSSGYPTDLIAALAGDEDLEPFADYLLARPAYLPGKVPAPASGT